MTAISLLAKFMPMHLCVPPPKPISAKRSALSSARSGAKRSGSYCSGAANSSGSWWATSEAICTFQPAGMR